MTTNKLLVCLAVISALGVSACSNTSQKPDTLSSIPEADPIPSAQGQSVGSPTGQIAKALDLDYSSPRQSSTYAPQHVVAQQASFVPAARSAASSRPPIAGYIPQPRPSNTAGGPRLSQNELRAIGQQIFVNEGGGNIRNLVHWNVGEDFASMGIGHFTWYPSGRRQSFGNTFPDLLDYMGNRGVQLPGWLQQARHSGAPWRSRGELLAARNSSQVRELQNLLYNTREIQAEYIVGRASRAMPRLIKTSSSQKRSHVANNLNAVANTPGGWYALIDYVNFKGEGLVGSGYRGKSWGLRQVLEEMRPSQPGQQALHEFADAAMRVLQRRVRNSDPRRNEARWLPGWRNRVNTYRNPVV